MKHRHGVMTGLIACLCTLLCFNTVMADDAADDNTGKDNPHVVHLYDDVNMIATLKYDYGKSKLFVKAVYPRLSRTDDDLDSITSDENNSSAINEEDNTVPQENDSISNVNQQIVALVKEEIQNFHTLVQQNANVQKNLPIKLVKNNLFIDYDTSFIVSDDGHIISLRFSLQRYLAGMAHPYHYYRVFNYNIDSDQIIQLSDLFTPNSNYLEFLAEFSRQILNKNLQDKTLIQQGTAPTEENFKTWNIKSNGILITFEQGQVAPYVQGAQSVLIPYNAFRGISAVNSPLDSCIKNPRHCANANLLTGGFIDES